MVGKKKPQTKAKAKVEEKFIAIQEDCENVLHDGSRRIFDSTDDIESMITEAMEDEDNGYEEGEGDVVIYKLVPVKVAKAKGIHFESA